MKRFLVVAVAVLIASAMSFGQQSSTDVEYAVTVAALGGPLTLAVGSGPIWDALKPGVNYVSIADQNYNVANLSPYDVNQGESFTPGDLTITGSPGAQVALTFIMPAKLFGTAAGTVNMSYDGFSASVVDVGSGAAVDFFNPLGGYNVTLDATGTAIIYMGGNPAPTIDATDGDTFLGYALVTAEYTGI
jgi:hypothetical protein